MPEVPSGYANICIPGQHPSMSKRVCVTFGVKNETGNNSPSSVAEAVWTAFSTSVRLVLDSDVTWGPVEASVNGGSGPLFGVGTSSQVGGGSIESVAVNTALLVQKLTSTPGKTGRGRYFWPFALEETDVDQIGLIDGTTQSDHQDVQDDFWDTLSTADVPMVVLHTGNGTPSLVTQLRVQPICGTQRKRMRG